MGVCLWMERGMTRNWGINYKRFWLVQSEEPEIQNRGKKRVKT